MIELSARVCPTLAHELEEFFSVWSPSPWLITVTTSSGAVSLVGYFADLEAARSAWRRLGRLHPGLPPEPGLGTVRERDWLTTYRDHFKPLRIRGLHWVPVWERETYGVPIGECALYLDPGMAFGTGDHPTTRLCGERLVDASCRWGNTLAERSVVDVGCGSGILAMSAALLGFGSVLALDYDAGVVGVCRENLKLNGLEKRVHLRCQDIETGLAVQSADLILANIQADVLIGSADILLSAVKPAGTLVLTGILADERSAAEMHFRSVAESLRRVVRRESRREGDWCDIALEFPQGEGSG